MTQTFQTNITVMQDADGIMEIFTVHTENGKKVLTMDEYIEREATIELLRSLGSRDYRREKGTIQEAIKMVSFPEYTPSADVAPVRHGRWKCNKPCPVCGGDRFEGLDADIWADWEPPYCPNCGAKMDGGKNDAAD